MLPSCPVERSSSAQTSQPSASSSSLRCDPMNPAPPVTSAFMLASLLTASDASESTLDRVRAGLEGQRGAQLAPCLDGLLRPEIREAELEPDLDRPRLLLRRLDEGRDRSGGRGRDVGLDDVRLDRERIEAPGPA